VKNKKLLSFINFFYALEGISFLIKNERNPVIYLVVTFVTILSGLFVSLSRIEWSVLILAMSIVWMAEALNTAVELVCDEVSEEKRERLRRAKDVAAGGVLIVALGALIVGILIFLPHVITLKLKM
jgi:diacylglycerol kinase (ATP)